MDSYQKTNASSGKYDLDSSKFHSENFMEKLLKEKSLKEIMEVEEKVVRDTQSLHSEMQTLVYENYNKFISATDTVKKMKSDFKHMETEMDLLASNINSITSFSDQISNTLNESRQKVAKLSSIHSLLKKLQFLYKLPNKLKQLVQEKKYSQAVEEYKQTEQILNHYSHLESFHGIERDCQEIITQLKGELRTQLNNNQGSMSEVAHSLELLVKLGEPTEQLYGEIIGHATRRLTDLLNIIENENSGQDLIDFVDILNTGYLNEFYLFVTAYNDMTSLQEPSSKSNEILDEFVSKRLNELISCVKKRFVKGIDSRSDVGIVVRALDRLYSKMVGLDKLFPTTNLTLLGMDLVQSVGEQVSEAELKLMRRYMSEAVLTVRETTAQSVQPDTSDLVNSFVLTTVEKMKGIMHELKMFVDKDVSFNCQKDFYQKFSFSGIYCGFVVNFLRDLVSLLSSSVTPQSPAAALLVLAKACMEFQSNHVNYLLTLTADWFSIKDTQRINSDREEICELMDEGAKDFINRFVKMQSDTICEMLRTSVETRDWVHCAEPRYPRLVVKRVLEEIQTAESCLGHLFDSSLQSKAPSSDSSRHKPTWSISTHHSQHIHKLFSEKIDIFSPVKMEKNSILTAIVKIGLKNLLECIRLKTLNKFGLQQIQVDLHYLQLYLWKYVTDENIIQVLLDEILSCSMHRCLNPVLMDANVVELLCEK